MSGGGGAKAPEGISKAQVEQALKKYDKLMATYTKAYEGQKTNAQNQLDLQKEQSAAQVAATVSEQEATRGLMSKQLEFEQAKYAQAQADAKLAAEQQAATLQNTSNANSVAQGLVSSYNARDRGRAVSAENRASGMAQYQQRQALTTIQRRRR